MSDARTSSLLFCSQWECPQTSSNLPGLYVQNPFHRTSAEWCKVNKAILLFINEHFLPCASSHISGGTLEPVAAFKSQQASINKPEVNSDIMVHVTTLRTPMPRRLVIITYVVGVMLGASHGVQVTHRIVQGTDAILATC